MFRGGAIPPVAVFISLKNDQLYLELKIGTVIILKVAKTTGFLIIISLLSNKASQCEGPNTPRLPVLPVKDCPSVEQNKLGCKDEESSSGFSVATHLHWVVM